MYRTQCWNAVRYTPSLTDISELKDGFVDDTEWFAVRVHRLRLSYHFATDSNHVLLHSSCWIFWTLCLNTEWAICSWYSSSLKRLNCWRKAVQCDLLFVFNGQLHVKFKFRYLLMFWMCKPRTVMSRSARLLSRGKVAFLARIPVETARYTFLRQIAANDDKWSLYCTATDT